MCDKLRVTCYASQLSSISHQPAHRFGPRYLGKSSIVPCAGLQNRAIAARAPHARCMLCCLDCSRHLFVALFAITIFLRCKPVLRDVSNRYLVSDARIGVRGCRDSFMCVYLASSQHCSDDDRSCKCVLHERCAVRARSLQCGGNFYTGDILGMLAAFTNLTMLTVTSQRLNGTLPAAMTAMTRLQYDTV